MSQSSSSVPRGSPTSQDDHTACGASDSATKERSASILSGRHDCNSRRYESLSQWYSRHLHSYLATSRKDAESASLAKLLDPACACFAPSIFHPQLPVRSSSPRAHFSFIFTPTTHFSKGPRSALISTRRHIRNTHHTPHPAPWVSCRSRSPPPTPPATSAPQPHRSTTPTMSTLFPESHARSWKAYLSTRKSAC